MVFDLCLHCKPLIQQFLDKSTGCKMSNFYAKVRSLNVHRSRQEWVSDKYFSFSTWKHMLWLLSEALLMSTTKYIFMEE